MGRSLAGTETLVVEGLTSAGSPGGGDKGNREGGAADTGISTNEAGAITSIEGATSNTRRGMQSIKGLRVAGMLTAAWTAKVLPVIPGGATSMKSLVVIIEDLRVVATMLISELTALVLPVIPGGATSMKTLVGIIEDLRVVATMLISELTALVLPVIPGGATSMKTLVGIIEDLRVVAAMLISALTALVLPVITEGATIGSMSTLLSTDGRRVGMLATKDPLIGDIQTPLRGLHRVTEGTTTNIGRIQKEASRRQGDPRSPRTYVHHRVTMKVLQVNKMVVFPIGQTGVKGQILLPVCRKCHMTQIFIKAEINDQGQVGGQGHPEVITEAASIVPSYMVAMLD